MARSLDEQRTIRRGKRALALIEKALAGELDEEVLKASTKKNMTFLRRLQKELASEGKDA